MAELLLEIFSEEIPARMQAQAGRDLERMAREHLAKAGLTPDSLTAYAGPRRLTLVAELAASTPDRTEELKGPRANAPEQALEGFLRKTGLTKAQLTERDGVFFATLTTPGRATAEIVAEAVPAIMAAFPWPKSMRSGTSHFRWVRPLKRILCLFDGKVVSFEAGGVASGDLTEGHRFMGPQSEEGGRAPFAVTGFADYAAKLKAHFVVLEQAERKRLILDGARAACAAEGLELVEDEGLLEEVLGLSEWPVPILGQMDPAFLDLPAEVIRTSMRTHQKYFAVAHPSSAHSRAGGNPDAASTAVEDPAGSPPARGRADIGKLAPRFVVVANVEPKDGGTVIAAGNAKVLSARLSDARFFWEQDTAPGSFDAWLKKLEGVTFHAKLGTMKERVDRIEALTREIAPLVGADPELAGIAARYCKADLASGMVGEFPELQGIMGGYYWRASLPLEGGGIEGGGASRDGASESDDGSTPVGAPSSPSLQSPAPTPIPNPSPIKGEGLRVVAGAIRDHYKPVGPSDSVPTAPVTVAVALADKLDTLVGFFAIDEKPTGSKDPYALRRAALGVIRLILNNEVRGELFEILVQASIEIETGDTYRVLGNYIDALVEAKERGIISPSNYTTQRRRALRQSYDVKQSATSLDRIYDYTDDLLAFFADRLKVLLRDEGKRHDLVDAVFALGDDDLVRITRRVEALSDFLATEDGANLLAGYKRATNILKAESKKASLPLEGGGIEGGGVPRDGASEGGEGSTSVGATASPSLQSRALTPIPGPSPLEGEGSLNASLATTTPEEAALAAALRVVEGAVDEALAAENFTQAMQHLAHLRSPVDAFFDKVLVNDPDPAVRLTRLRLLTQVRDTANRVADFSLISG